MIMNHYLTNILTIIFVNIGLNKSRGKTLNPLLSKNGF